MARLKKEKAPADVCDRRVWEMARTTIGLARKILGDFAELPTDNQFRDVVLAALLRRTIVTTISICELLKIGQFESAAVLTRTLIEIELSVKLVVADETNRMITRLAAFDYHTRQAYGHKLLSDPETRANLESIAGQKEDTAAVVRSWRDQFEGPAFAAVRDELLRDIAAHRGWHGLGSLQDAFSSVASTPDYFQQYGLYSPYVHGTNVEADMESTRDGKPYIRGIFWSDAARLTPSVAIALFRLYAVLLDCTGDQLSRQPLSDRALQAKRTTLLQTAKADILLLGPRLSARFGDDRLTQLLNSHVPNLWRESKHE